MSASGTAAFVAVAVLVGALHALVVPPLWAAAGSSAGVPAAGASQELIVCGGDEVYILDLAREENGKPKKVWSWRAKDRPELPRDLFPLGWEFNDTTECKPVDGGRVLISCDTSGIALVERASGRVLFYAKVESAHSAEALPGNRVAVASSVYQGTETPLNADSLTIFDATGHGKELCRTELRGGHGVVWDPGRQILWALSSRDIRAYRLVEWETDHPLLEFIAVVDLPEGSGHDLYPLPQGPLMTVTSGAHCWLFDRDKRSFRLHPELREVGRVKSISVNPLTGQVAYVQAEGENWWAERVRFMQPDKVVDLAEQRVYKARWNTPVR